MTTKELRRRLKKKIDCLSAGRLKVAEDFIAYLDERESCEATEELMNIPGLRKELDRAEKDIAAGKTTPVEKLKRKY